MPSCALACGIPVLSASGKPAHTFHQVPPNISVSFLTDTAELEVRTSEKAVGPNLPSASSLKMPTLAQARKARSNRVCIRHMRDLRWVTPLARDLRPDDGAAGSTLTQRSRKPPSMPLQIPGTVLTLTIWHVLGFALQMCPACSRALTVSIDILDIDD